MSDVDLGVLVGARVQYVIEAALEAMPADVKAERIAYCRRTGEHGVSTHHTPEGIELRWAGERLAFIDANALTEDALLFRGIDGEAVDPS